MIETHERDRKRAQRARLRSAAAAPALTPDQSALLAKYDAHPHIRAALLDRFAADAAPVAPGRGQVLRDARADLRRAHRALQRLDARREVVRGQVDAAAAVLRSQGVSWDVLAKELGVTRQAVIKRYRGES